MHENLKFICAISTLLSIVLLCYLDMHSSLTFVDYHFWNVSYGRMNWFNQKAFCYNHKNGL